MFRYDNCPNCFQPLNGNTICGQCFFDINDMKTTPGALPLFTTLNNRYLLGRVLGKGGFGITYVAKDMQTNKICAIKEYMPADYASREGNVNSVQPFSDPKAKYIFEHGREKFIEEADVLKKLLNNPVVVDIWDYFPQNNTAYLVMEFLNGQDLRKMAHDKGGKIDPDFAKIIFLTVASALMEVHRLNILHRDLSPENIFILKDGQIKLIDFGAARNYVNNQNKGMSVLLKPGFAPPEQYHSKGVQGPWSDVYALCATFYNIVSGKYLSDALSLRDGQLLSLYSMGCTVSKKTSDVIEKGMALDYSKRYQNFKQLLDDIDMPNLPSRPYEPNIPIRNENDTVIISPVKPGNPVPYVTTNIPGISPNKSKIDSYDFLKIGRSKERSNFVLDHDNSISRPHCCVRYDSAKNIFYLMDVSANGTFFADGSRLIKNNEYEIPPGTKFYLASKNNMLTVDVER